MSLRDGWPAVSNAADQFDIRAALRVDTALDSDGNIKTGVAVTGKSLSGLVTARSDMQVDVAAFAATLDRQGPVKLYNDGVVQVKLDAAPTANSRIDAIYVKQQETASPISDSADGPIFGKVTGTPSTSPTPPAVPTGAMRLADVTVPSTATSTSSSGVTITQRYPYTVSAGGLMQFRVADDLNAWNAPDGYRARLLDGREFTRAGGVWVLLGSVVLRAGEAAVSATNDAGAFMIDLLKPASGYECVSLLLSGKAIIGFNDSGESGRSYHQWDKVDQNGAVQVRVAINGNWSGRTVASCSWLAVWARHDA